MTPRTRLAAAVATAILLSVVTAQAQAPEKRPISFQDLISLHRLSEPQLSPDAKWIAYSSDESGRSEVYVRPFQGAPARSLAKLGAKCDASWAAKEASRPGRRP